MTTAVRNESAGVGADGDEGVVGLNWEPLAKVAVFFALFACGEAGGAGCVR